jgi:c-di-GMP-binding flagellar brake protein YcgR
MGEGFLDVFAARDISAGGVGIVVPHRFEGCAIDQEVDLVISLPGERPFMARGRIVHRTKTHQEFFGVEFARLSRNHRSLLERYVDARLREAS